MERPPQQKMQNLLLICRKNGNRIVDDRQPRKQQGPFSPTLSDCGKLWQLIFSVMFVRQFFLSFPVKPVIKRPLRRSYLWWQKSTPILAAYPGPKLLTLFRILGKMSGQKLYGNFALELGVLGGSRKLGDVSSIGKTFFVIIINAGDSFSKCFINIR